MRAMTCVRACDEMRASLARSLARSLACLGGTGWGRAVLPASLPAWIRVHDLMVGQELMHSGTAFKSMVRDAIEPIGQEWQEQTETDNSSRVMRAFARSHATQHNTTQHNITHACVARQQAKLLSNIEQELTKQNLDPANTLHLLEIVNEIKEAMMYCFCPVDH